MEWNYLYKECQVTTCMFLSPHEEENKLKLKKIIQTVKHIEFAIKNLDILVDQFMICVAYRRFLQLLIQDK